MGTVYGKSFKDVEKFMEQKITYALKQTQNEVYKVIQDFIRQYYDEQVFYDGNVMTNKPNYYERTFAFFNSLVKSEVKHQGNKYWCEVYIDPMQLDYYANSGLEVLEMINRGYHADTSMNNGTYETPYNIHSEIHFWDDALDTFERANFILSELVYYLKRAGLTVVG
jgi:hypothetical protein